MNREPLLQPILPERAASWKRSLQLRDVPSIITITVEGRSGQHARQRPGLLSRFLGWFAGLVGKGSSRSSGDVGEKLASGELSRHLTLLSNYLQVLKGLGTHPDVAHALAVTSDELTTWISGQIPGEDKLRLLRDLGVVVSHLTEYYDPRVVPDWLYGENPDLGGRLPITVLRDGGLAEVLSVVDAQTSGSYI